MNIQSLPLCLYNIITLSVLRLFVIHSLCLIKMPMSFPLKNINYITLCFKSHQNVINSSEGLSQVKMFI